MHIIQNKIYRNIIEKKKCSQTQAKQIITNWNTERVCGYVCMG